MEKEAANTAENVTKTMELLDEIQLYPKTIIAVHMPYALRRDYSIFRKEWPETGVVMASPDVPFGEYHLSGFQKMMTRRMLISDMLGDTQRWAIYPWRMEDEIPDYVLDAYDDLADRGYDEHLLEHGGKIIDIRQWAKKRCPEDFYK